MALTQAQIEDVWEGRIAAEIRSLYFADLAGLYTRQKKWINCVSFFLSTGAAVDLIEKLPSGFAVFFSLVVAAGAAYSMAVNLDSKTGTMSKLHFAWTQITIDYKKLWNHTYRDEAEAEFEDLQQREAEMSELATAEAPNDRKRMEHWTDQVLGGIE